MLLCKALAHEEGSLDVVEDAVLLEDLVVEVAEVPMLLQAKHTTCNVRKARMIHLIEWKWPYVTHGCCVTNVANGENTRAINAS